MLLLVAPPAPDELLVLLLAPPAPLEVLPELAVLSLLDEPQAAAGSVLEARRLVVTVL